MLLRFASDCVFESIFSLRSVALSYVTINPKLDESVHCTATDGPISPRFTPPRDPYRTLAPPRSRSLLRRDRSGGSGDKVCREHGVDILLDSDDLVTLRAEHEDEYVFTVEPSYKREGAQQRTVNMSCGPAQE